MNRNKSGTISMVITGSIVMSIIILYFLSIIQNSFGGYFRSIDEAVERLNKYINQHPKDTEAMLYLARIYINDTREYEKAENLLTQIIQIDPKHEKAIYTYGRLLVDQFKFPEAIEQFEKVAIIDKTPTASLQYLTNIYLIYDSKKALEYAKKATDLQRQLYNQEGQHVNIAFYEKRENIVAEFNSKFEKDPATATLEILEHLDPDTRIQIELCNNALKSDIPSDPQKMQELLERLGMLYTEIGMHEKAVETYKILVETIPTYGKGYILLADRLIKTDNLISLDELYHDIQNQKGLDTEEEIINALVQYKNGKTDYALKELEKINSERNDIILNHILGMLYENIGDKENAIAAYRKVINDNPEVKSAEFYFCLATLDDIYKAISTLKPYGDPRLET